MILGTETPSLRHRDYKEQHLARRSLLGAVKDVKNSQAIPLFSVNDDVRCAANNQLAKLRRSKWRAKVWIKF